MEYHRLKSEEAFLSVLIMLSLYFLYLHNIDILWTGEREEDNSPNQPVPVSHQQRVIFIDENYF